MKKTILILHGWRLSGKRYSEIEHIFTAKGYQVLTPDLPGFGEEPLKKDAMTISDYVAYVKKYLDAKKIAHVYIIGHSFGSRVAAKFAATHPSYVDKIVFTGSPLIKTKLSTKKRVVSFVAKKGKMIAMRMPFGIYRSLQWMLYRLLGEWDYYKSENLRQTFLNVIQEDLVSYLPKIQAETLVLWGQQDTFVLPSVGQTIARIIPHAKFLAIPDIGHGFPYTHAKKFSQLCLNFFEK